MTTANGPILRAAATAGVVLGLAAGLAVSGGSSSLGAQARRGASPRPATPPLELPERPLSQILRVSGVQSVIGTDSAAGPLMFGQIVGVAIDGGSTVYVSDYPASEIRAFDTRGRHLSTFGRRGRGPGEFVNPIGLFHDGDSTMFAWQMSFGVAERREIRAFGAPIHVQENAAVRAFANRSGAILTCDEPTGTIYAASIDMGVIRSYALDGSLRWQTTLPDFKHAIYGANPGGGAFVAWSIDFISGIQPIAGGRLLLHVGSLDFESTGSAGRAARGTPGATIQPDITRRITYAIDAPTGRLLSRSSVGSELVVFRDSLAAERVTDPWPMVRLRTVRALPR